MPQANSSADGWEPVAEAGSGWEPVAAPPATTVQPVRSLIDRLTEIQKPDPNSPAFSMKEAGRAVGNIGAGGLSVFLHPLDTLAGIGGIVTAPIESAIDSFERLAGHEPKTPALPEQMIRSLRENPMGTIEAGIGATPVMEAAGGIAGRVLPKIAEAPETLARTISGTGKKPIAGLIRDTKAQNAAEVERVAAANEVETTKAAEASRKAATTHSEAVQDALQETKGRETEYLRALREEAEKTKSSETSEAAKQRAAHESATREVAEANQTARQKAEAETLQKQQDFFRKKAEHAQVTEAAKAENARLTAEHEQLVKQQQEAQARLNQSERDAKVKMRKVERDVHADADAKYEALKPQLAEVEANPDASATISEDAAGLIQPATGEPPLLAKFRKMSANDALTYKDYDNFRSAITREMRKGNVNGDHWHIYETMMDGVTDPETGETTPGIISEMSRIAGEKGLSAEADAARAAWRQWAQSFRDRTSPLRKVLKGPEAHGLLRTMRGKQSYLDRLAAFGPEGGTLANQIGMDLQDAQATGAKFSPYGEIQVPGPKAPTLNEITEFSGEPPQAKAPTLKPAPQRSPLQITAGTPEERAAQTVPQPLRAPVPPRPAEILPKLQTPEVKAIGPEDIQDAKLKSLEKRTAAIRHRGAWIATGAAGYRALSAILHGNLAAVPADLLEGGIALGGVEGIARILERPSVQEFLTRPTPADVAQIPPELRSDLGQVVQIAQSKGIKVDPRIVSAVSGVAGALSATKKR